MACPIRLGIPLYRGFDSLDVLGPFQVFTLLNSCTPKELELIAPAEGPWIVRLLVDGAFVPAERDGSGDTRLLGVKISMVPAANRRP